MSWAGMVVAIVLIVTIGRVASEIFSRNAGKIKRRDIEHQDAEIRALKERIAVLERLATDDGARLTHEIERLRGPDRP